MYGLSTILFPSLNLKFNISKIAITIGGLSIYWYGVLFVVAFLCAILLFKKWDNKFDIKFIDVLELIIFLIPISLICARIYYVIFNLGYYLSNPLQIFNTRSRRNGYIWRDYWRNYNYLLFLQKEKNIFSRFNRLYGARISIADKQLAG